MKKKIKRWLGHLIFIHKRSWAARSPGETKLDKFILRTAPDGAEGGHDVWVCFFQAIGGSGWGGRLNVSRPAFTSSRRTGSAFWFQGMFGLAWKLNSTLYWIARRLRVVAMMAAAAPSLNFQSPLNHFTCSNLTGDNSCVMTTFLRLHEFLPFNPVSVAQVCPTLKLPPRDNQFDLVCTATDHRSS